MEEKASVRRNNMQSLENAVSILLSFSDEDRPLGVTEIARRLDLHKSTVSRHLSMLARVGFVVREAGSQKFTLGMGLLPLAASVLARHPLSAIARQRLEDLAARTHGSVTISGWDGRNAVNLYQFGRDRYAPPGRLNPAHCTATGKIFLANCPADRIEAILSHPLKRYTARTLTDREKLLKQIEDARRGGVAFSHGEFIDKIFSLASVIHDKDGHIRYAIAITMPIAAADPETVKRLEQDLGKFIRESSDLFTTNG